MPSTRPDTRLRHRQVYETAVAFIAARHGEPLALEEVARRTMTSTRQLQRILRDEGASFRRLLLQARMTRARELLETEMPIGEVARAVGYLHVAQFSKAFRNHFGHPPSACRS